MKLTSYCLQIRRLWETEIVTIVDIGSYHRFVTARVEINKKLMRLKKKPKNKSHSN